MMFPTMWTCCNLRFCLSSIRTAVAVVMVWATLSSHASVLARDGSQVVIPVVFEENRGQFGGDAVFVSRSNGALALFKSDEFDWILGQAGGTDTTTPGGVDDFPQESVRLKLQGAAIYGPPVGQNRYRAGANYFYGNNADDWFTEVPQYGTIEYAGVYEGIDLIFHGRRGTIEYDFVVAPGADPGQIQIAVEGASRLDITAEGDLIVGTPSGREIVHKKPLIYQVVAEQHVFIAGSFKLVDQMSYGFELGSYDAELPLVIDPVLYATPMPGADSSWAECLQVDDEGHVYIVGPTQTPNFPVTPGALEDRCRPDFFCGGYRRRDNSFLLKLDPDASAENVIIYSSYIPASACQHKIDRHGIMYFLAGTRSVDFPTTPNAFDNRCMDEPVSAPGPQECNSGVVMKIDPSLRGRESILYSTYFPGGEVLGFDGSGKIYVAGRTTLPTFPVTRSAIDFDCGMVDESCDRLQGDAFFAKFDPDAPAERSLAYSTLFGEFGWETKVNLHVSDDGTMFFLLQLTYDVGSALYTAIPTTQNAVATNRRGADAFGGGDAFSDIYIGVLKPEGNGLDDLKFGTFLGGLGLQTSRRRSLAVDETGYITVAIESPLGQLPITPNNVLSASDRTSNLYIIQLDPARTDPVLYATYLGGNSFDSLVGVDVDEAGFIYVISNTRSSDLPTRGALYFGCGAGSRCDDSNWFLAKLDPKRQDSLVYSTYGGGSGNDAAISFSYDPIGSFFVDSDQNVYLEVVTTSDTLPVTEGRADRRNDDGYIIKVRTSSSGPESIAYATFVGGRLDDYIWDFKLDSSGRIHVIGLTESDDFPFSPNALGTFHQKASFYMLLDPLD